MITNILLHELMPDILFNVCSPAPQNIGSHSSKSKIATENGYRK